MIDKKIIEHIGDLARLEISNEEAQEYGVHLGKAIEHFKSIASLNTDGIEPLITPTEIEAFYREDKIIKEYSAEEMTSNAPDRAGNLFRVPPVV